MSKTTNETVGKLNLLNVDYSMVANKLTTSDLSDKKTSDRAQYIAQTTNAPTVSLRNPNNTIASGEQFLISISDIANMYKGSKIDPLYYFPVKSGQNLYVQLIENVTATSSDSDSAPVTLPFSVSMSIKVPDASLSSDQKAAVVTESLIRLLSYIYPKGTGDLATLVEMINKKLV